MNKSILRITIILSLFAFSFEVFAMEDLRIEQEAFEQNLIRFENGDRICEDLYKVMSAEGTCLKIVGENGQVEVAEFPELTVSRFECADQLARAIYESLKRPKTSNAEEGKVSSPRSAATQTLSDFMSTYKVEFLAIALLGIYTAWSAL